MTGTIHYENKPLSHAWPTVASLSIPPVVKLCRNPFDSEDRHTRLASELVSWLTRAVNVDDRCHAERIDADYLRWYRCRKALECERDLFCGHIGITVAVANDLGVTL